MHAQTIIQDLLTDHCSSMHDKRRQSLAALTDAAGRGGLGLLKMSKSLKNTCSLRHRIKRCDRLLSNAHLANERIMVYRALSHRVLEGQSQPCIIVDWSDLLPDTSQHMLRAAVAVKGRAIVIYEEIHPNSGYGKATVHASFMKTLRTILPTQCQPVIITDAGFRATWFKMLDMLGFAWIGRIRNVDTVRAQGNTDWLGCKQYYADTKGRSRDLGLFDYTQRSRVQCRLVLIKRAAKGRKRKTRSGKSACSARSNKQRKGQREPWLLAVSSSLAKLSAQAVVDLYAKRMQIEQSFRDLKNPAYGMGLSTSQTRKLNRMRILLLIGALLSYALWLIGLSARQKGFEIGYGSKKKAPNTLSILSLAQLWLSTVRPKLLSKRQINTASKELASMVVTF